MFREFKIQAFETIRQNFGPMMLMSLVAMLLSFTFIAPQIAIDSMNNVVGINFQIFGVTIGSILPFTDSYDTFMMIYPIFMLVVFFFLSIPISYGMEKYFVHVTKGKSAFDFKVLFSAYKDGFGKIVVVNLLVSIITSIGTLFFFIPGLIFTYMYLYVNMIMIKHPELGVWDTMRKSVEITRGFKMQLFWLALSFILWFLLGGITLGISNIFLNAYTGLTFVLVFNALQREEAYEKV